MQWWNLATGACEARVATARPCDFLACSPQGELIALRDSYGSFALWDPTTQEIRRRVAAPAGEVFSPVFSADGARLAASSDRGTLWCWDVSSEQIAESWPGHTSLVHALAYVADENLFVSGGYDGKLRFWREVPQSFTELTPKHAAGVIALAFVPANSQLISGSRNGELKIWNLADGWLVEALGNLGDSAGVMTVSPDGKTLAYCADKRAVSFWDLGERRVRGQLPPQREPLYGIAYAPQGNFLAAGGGIPQSLWPGEPTDLRLWQLDTNQVRHQLQGNRRVVRCLAFSPDGLTLATGGFDRRVLIWDVTSGVQRYAIDTQGLFNVMCLTFSPDGHTLAFGTSDGTVWLADPVDNKTPRQITGQDGTVWAVAYSPDGKSLAAAFGQQFQGANELTTIKLWDTATTELKLRLNSSAGPPQSLAFSPDGEVLAAGFNDGTIHLWRAPQRSIH